MNPCEKICLLNTLAEPYGFFWLPSQRIISSTLHAWQRKFGYCTLYDRSAPYFNMVFDCAPVFFNYDGRTWLIEFWKGQYGINTGCEVGVYRADTIIKEKELDRTLFRSVPDEEMLPLSMKLLAGEEVLFCTDRIHWWLTGFLTGVFHRPEELTMYASVTFPDPEMRNCFVRAAAGKLAPDDCRDHLKQSAAPRLQICSPAADRCDCTADCDCLTVSVCFPPRTEDSCSPAKTLRRSAAIPAAAAQRKNRIFCRLYLAVTRPFTETPDRLLCLYYLLPSAFRRLLRFSKNRKMKPPKELTHTVRRRFRSQRR